MDKNTPNQIKRTNSEGISLALWEEGLGVLGRIVLLTVLMFTLAILGMAWFPAGKTNTAMAGFDWPRVICFLIAPAGCLVWVILAASRFLQDVYGVEGFPTPIKYMLSSLFGLGLPRLTIDGGKVVTKEDEINPIEVFGGPGTVTVQPGNAVMFRLLRNRSRFGVTRSVFLRRFETLGMIADLADQEETVDELGVVTRDGIKVNIKGIKYRYRVISDQPKSLENPYPFVDEELDKMAYNIAVGENGQPGWRVSIRQAVVTYVKEFLGGYSIDDLTAPRSDRRSPWRELHARITTPAYTPQIRSMGARVIWFDLGHIHIESEIINESRIGYWAADWVGQAEKKKAYSDGARLAYQEQAWAEAQAEIIMSITNGLNGINLQQGSDEGIRQVFLDRTSQLLNAFTPKENPNNNEINRDIDP